ncbi:MAG: murein L,D-transpeptidase [Propionibacteriaceae bacterium]|nr:murein L,D-transpeptidase [Propionibacteriaceae bacterium]
MATALISAAGLSSPSLATPAQAATTSYPKKGQTSAKVTQLQQRLVKARMLSSRYVTGYYGNLTAAAVKRFQRKYNISQTGTVNKKTWDTLVAKTGTITKPTVKGIDKRCKVSGRVLCIDKTRDKLYYLKNSRVIKTMDARFGCANTRTREGRFTVYRKSRNHVSSIYHTPMPYAMFFSGGQAVHYSPDFAARGYRGCSHGCVNIRDRAGIRWLFDQIRIGDRVIVYKR